MTTTPETRVVHDDVREMLIRTMGCAVSKLADGDLLSELADDFLVTANFVMSAPAAPAPEPVAYRWTPKTIRMWAYGAQVPHGADDRGFEIQPLYAAPPAPVAASAVDGRATHRHVKRGTLYRLLGFGKMQAEWWRKMEKLSGSAVKFVSADMTEVAVYQSVDDGSLWVRPKDEFEDGRFEAISNAPNPVADNPAAETIVNAPRVRELEWGDPRTTEDGRTAEDAKTPFGRYVATDTGWFLIGQTGYETERGLQAAKAAAQADYERRVLACLEPGQGWRDIRSAPDRALIVAKAINITLPSGQKYTSDPWVVWRQDGSYARWPHDFQPTHFIPLPPAAEGK